ncbi:MAG: tetratricopeptide repeat protein, partial [Planctomycetaceae bacterium]|nr:tetratricopeptide repeat protein [Planctomycetaceae bacterium]
QAGTLHNLAMVQQWAGKFEHATENLRKAVALDQEILKMRPDDSLARIQLQKHANELVKIGNQRRSPQLVAEGKKLSVQLASIDPEVSSWNDALQTGIGISEVPIDELEAGAKAAVACRAFATGADLYLELANRDPNWKSTPENWNALVNASVAAGTNQSLERQLSESQAKTYREVGRETLAQTLANARAEPPATNLAVRQIQFDRFRKLEEDKVIERVRSPFYLQQLDDSEREAWLILWKEMENHLTTLQLTLKDQAELADFALSAQRVRVANNPSDPSRITLSQLLSTQSQVRSNDLRYAEAIQSVEESIVIREDIYQRSPPILQDRFSLLEDQIRLADLQFGLERIDQAYASLEAVEAELLREEAKNDDNALSWTYGRLLLSRSRLDASQGRLAAAHAHLDLAAGYCERAFQINLQHGAVPYYHAILREYLDLAGRKSDPALEGRARERLAEFVKRLPDYHRRLRMIDDVLLRGWDYSAEFMYTLAMTALESADYQNAARLYEKALDPNRIDSLRYRKSSLFHAASAYVLAAEVLEVDSSQAHNEEARRLRLAAYDQLEEAISGDLQPEKDSLIAIHEIPARWERSPNLKSVRDPKFLEKMEPDEQERWTNFWSKVRDKKEELRQKGLSPNPLPDN